MSHYRFCTQFVTSFTLGVCDLHFQGVEGVTNILKEQSKQGMTIIESDELDVESTELTDILAFDTEHKEEFETLLVDEEENYQRDVKSLLKLFVDIITPSHSKNLQGGGLLQN